MSDQNSEPEDIQSQIPKQNNPSTTNTEQNESEDKVPKWYVLRVQSGKEDRVKLNLEARIQSMEMQDRIFRVLVPLEKVIDPSKKSKRVTYRKMYPGYVIVEMIKTEQTHFMVKTTPGVGDFAGTMSDVEVERMMLVCEYAKAKKSPFRKGQQIRIKDGPFQNQRAVVEEVDDANALLKVRVDMWGRFSEVTLEFRQVEDISSSATV